MPTASIRRAFKNPSNQPPGGEYVFWGEDGLPRTRSFDRSVFIRSVQVLLGEAGITVSSDEAWRIAMDNMCGRLPFGFCTGGKPDFSGVTIPEVKKRTAELFALPPATPGEVSERLALCLSCPRHDRTVCTSCDGLSTWAVRGVRRTRIPADSYAGICLADKAFVSALVSVILPPDTKNRPPSCWRQHA